MCKCSGKCGCNITSTTKGEKGEKGNNGEIGPEGPQGPGGADFLYATVNLVPNQIKSLFSSPVEAIASPGTGFAILPIQIASNYIFNTESFENNVSMTIQSASSNLFVKTTSIYASDRFVIEQFGNNSTSQLKENSPLIINSTEDSTTGDGSLVIYISYRIISV